jgi:hypothetical protein
VPNGAKQATLVSVVHAVVRQAVPPMLMEGLASEDPKLRPDRVTEAVGATVGLLTSISVIAGASKVNELVRVPGMLSTLTRTAFVGPVPAATRQNNWVAVDQATVLQDVPATLADEDRSAYPKLRPNKVSDAPPMAGPFGTTSPVGTGASYVNLPCRHPTCEVTDTETNDGAPAGPDDPAGAAHSTDDDVRHWVVWQTRSEPTPAVTELSIGPKFVPPNVSVAPPVNGPLYRLNTSVTTGLLNENTLAYVPKRVEIVTGMSRRPPVPGGDTTTTLVVVVHVAVLIRVPPIVTVGVTSSRPKLLPCIVTDVPPEVGAFLGRKFVDTGASNVKENCWGSVPTMPETVAEAAR